MLVMKFGGTSVGDAARISELIRIVKAEMANDLKIAVVVSAMSGVTNNLLNCARAASRGEQSQYEAICQDLLRKHRIAVLELVKDAVRCESLLKEIELLVERNCSRLCYGIQILGEASPRALDAIASVGERLSARIVAAALQEAGIAAEWVEAVELIVTDNNYGDAAPLMSETEAHTRSRLLPIFEKGHIPVITGFIGATRDGVTTTLGRGGSDYSAGIIGSCLKSDEVWIWTDVDGVMTADPSIVEKARTLPEITYSEAAELSYFGAKVLHPKTVLPVIKDKIPLRIKNSFYPDRQGTYIAYKTGLTGSDVKAITSIIGISLITISGRGMMGVPGIAAKTFTAAASQNVNVLMISQSSSENNICFVINTSEVERTRSALRRALEIEFHHKHVEEIFIQDDVAIIAVVGERMKGTPGIAARIFGAVGSSGANIIAIAQGSSEINVSFVIEKRDVARSVKAIHDEFHLEAQ
jgi:bifunctional aspartokinase / homoserine dehydrogenase 1